MDRVRDIFLYFVAALAMFALLCAVYQAMNGKNGSALTLGSIFLVCAFIVFIPQLEVLKAWGVEAKLRQSLDRAEEIIGRLRRLSEISAKAIYTTMAWENRMGSPSAKTKQQILDDVDKQLASLDVTAEERAEIVRPYIQFIELDYFNIFTRVIDRYTEWKRGDLGRRLQAANTDENRQAVQRFSVAQSKWRSSAFPDNELERLRNNAFESELKRVTPDWLDTNEAKALEGFRNELVRLFDECEKKGGYTNDGADFYDRYSDMGGWDLKIKELFGVNPSEVK